MSKSIERIEVEWLGHAGFKLKNEAVVYLDPYLLPSDPEKADIILISHDHYDHCDSDKVRQLTKEGTVIVTTSACAAKLEGDIKVVNGGDEVTVKNIAIKAVPAYNIGKPYHSRGSGVGYVFRLGGKNVYYGGDTDHIPEMEELGEIDIALLPIGGTYTMDVNEAAEAAGVIKPKVVIPMHYNYVSGTGVDTEEFKELVAEEDPQIKVEIL